MTFSQWMGLGAGVLLVSFIIFAFRQGLRVRPNGGGRNTISDLGGPGDTPSSHGG